MLEFSGVSLCNLHPNTILHIYVFIHFCEVYLGIFPILISSDICSGSRRKEGAVPKLSAVCIYSSAMGW